MKQCKNYTRYKGLRKPRCNYGSGCDACNIKFAEVMDHYDVKTYPYGVLRIGDSVLRRGKIFRVVSLGKK
jgi:hypothetical protein